MSTTKTRIVVVGDAGLDIVVMPTRPVVADGDVPARIRVTTGGAGANTAAWLAYQGARVTLVTRVGDDLAGQQVRDTLSHAGVDCALPSDPDQPTGCVVVLVDDRGSRSMLSDRGANARLGRADVESVQLTGISHLHLSGYVLLDDSSVSAGVAALAAARADGLTTSVDPQAAMLITDPDSFLRLVGGVDLLLPNVEELAALTGSADPASARALLGDVGAVAVTAGAAGASWIDRSGVVRVPATRATALDTTGAGDAFNAGALSAWLGGHGPEDILRAGVRLGTEAVTTVGGQPLSPRRRYAHRPRSSGSTADSD